MTSAGERVVPYHCPYCASENLRPSEEGHGTWECHSCARVFSVKFVGLLPRDGARSDESRSDESRSHESRSHESRSHESRNREDTAVTK